jgi:hypothetical protein
VYIRYSVSVPNFPASVFDDFAAAYSVFGFEIRREKEKAGEQSRAHPDGCPPPVHPPVEVVT